MKRTLIKLICFIPFSVLVYVLLIFLSGNYAPIDFNRNLIYLKGGYGHTFSRLKDAGYQQNVDVLILGSSYAYRGLDTRIFQDHDIKAFNLGSSAQTPFQTKLLLDYYLDRLNPKKVVYVVSPISFSGDGLESSLDIVANIQEIKPQFFSMLLDIKNIKLLNTILFSGFEDIFNSGVYKEPIRKGADLYIPGGGFVQRDLGYYKPDKEIKKRLIRPKAKQLEVFKNILNQLSERDIELFLVRPPVSKNSYYSISNNTNFNEMMPNFGSYKDYNQELTLMDSLHFYDSHHLNQNGVEIFSAAVVEDIMKK